MPIRKGWGLDRHVVEVDSVSVPTILTEVMSGNCHMLYEDFYNSGPNKDVIVTITDLAGQIWYTSPPLRVGDFWSHSSPGKFMAGGCKWRATAAGIMGNLIMTRAV